MFINNTTSLVVQFCCSLCVRWANREFVNPLDFVSVGFHFMKMKTSTVCCRFENANNFTIDLNLQVVGPAPTGNISIVFILSFCRSDMKKECHNFLFYSVLENLAFCYVVDKMHLNCKQHG